MNRFTLKTGLRILAAWFILPAMIGTVAEPIFAQGLGLDHEAEYRACMALAQDDPAQALKSALVWADQGGGVAADHCIAVAMLGQGRFGESAERLEILAESLGPELEYLRSDVLAQSGQAWLLAGDLKRAASAQTAALALSPDDPELRIDRSMTLAMNGQYWEAIDDLNEANSQAPDRADIYVFRASAYRQVEAFDLALQDLDAAFELDPENVEALLERGNLHRLMGRDDEARDDWLRVTSLAPESPAADAARANLERLDVDKN